ncbi:Caspase-9 [Cricetulus griseus]|uniref:Caspase-9 n=1 Tax=Cricetulus griseus TaxID=10029 RepID=G3I954_CRIGR|nr:Caspase-9 [Cricetulus griseus]
MGAWRERPGRIPSRKRTELGVRNRPAMDEADRQLLRRCRVRLVSELQVAELWDALLSRELFSGDMIEDIQRAGSGSRRDQARQLVTDLETRGKQALPLFISCLEDTGQDTLASFLRSSRQAAKQDPEAAKPLDHLVPVVLGPMGIVSKEQKVVKLEPSKPALGNLTPVVLGPEGVWPATLRPEVLRPETPRPVDISSGGTYDVCAAEKIRSSADMAYILDADPCGYCLIINNVNFCPSSGLGTRTGSSVDCEKLQFRFRWLHFMVEVQNDLTAKKMVAALMEMAGRDHRALDCFVVGPGPHDLCWLPRLDHAYILDADPCGYCLIINNVNFCPSSGLGTRTGSSVDCEKLQFRFRWLHFMVEVQNDLTAKKMVAALMEMAGRDHRALDCFVVVILSHGCQSSHLQFPGAVYGTDGCSVSVEKIVNIFSGTGCPSLGGKPKLFFIQACGGEQKDHGFEVACTSSRGRDLDSDSEPDAVPYQEGPRPFDQLDAVSSLPTPSDILVSYSTFPGFVSWRDKKSGSWYIETLDGVLEQWAHSEDLQSLLLRAYILDADPCGYCLIVSNVNFCPSSGLGTRTGSSVDCEKLQFRFRWLHFMVEVQNDLTAKKMVAALMEMAGRDHRALDCFVVVILSHGCQASHLQFSGAFSGTDGCSVSIEKIVNIFSGPGCPSLGGKPKLFFIQACGGGMWHS